MTRSTAIRVSAIIGFAAVALGAFGAHGLEATLLANGRLDSWETAVLYHFVHALAMLVVSVVPHEVPKGPWLSFLVGIIVFSGSLYALALSNLTWLGAITPIGGVSFLVGWAWLVWKPVSGR